MSQSIFMRIFNRPYLLVLSWIITVISIFVAVFFYLESRDVPQLAYTIKPVRGIVVRGGKSSKLTVQYAERKVETDITAAQLVLWNEGKHAIKRAAILRPIIIHTETNAPILEASIKKTTNEIIGLKLNHEENQQDRVIVSWDILEQGEGGTIQIVYEGSPDMKLLIDGAVEGQKQINRFEAPVGSIYRREFNRSARKSLEYYEIFIIITTIIMVLFFLIVPEAVNGIIPKWLRIPLLLLFVVCIGILVYDVRYGYVEPPFGF
jgi:hypothetical protein